MGIRGRLIAAMSGVVLLVVVALVLPIWVSAGERAVVELENRNLVVAEAIAQRFGPETMSRENAAFADALVEDFATQVGGRVLVVDADGLLVADSDGSPRGTSYATPGRPEILSALDRVPASDVRYSFDLAMDLMVTAVPIFHAVTPDQPGSDVIGAVRISQSLDAVRDANRRTVLGLVAVGGATLAGGLLLAWALAGSLSRPLRDLASTTHRLGEGDLDARVGDVGGGPEVLEVAVALDAMAARLQRLIGAQREFVGNASHQLRTPLTGMKLQLEGALASTDDPDLRAQLEAADREVDRLADIVGRLLATAAGSNLGLEDPGDAVVTARIDRTDADQILDILIENAIAHGGPPIGVALRYEDGSVVLSVTDGGTGIPAGDLERVTERFYRGAGVRASGSGLGLAIARGLAESAGGTLEIASAPGRTVVAARLPAA